MIQATCPLPKRSEDLVGGDQATQLPPKPEGSFGNPASALFAKGRSPARIEHLRSLLPRPRPRLDRTSGRDDPESFLAFRGLIPAAIRHSRASCLGRREARSSHGLSALQGFPPHCGGAAFTVPSPHRLRVTGRERPVTWPSRVSAARLARLSRDRRPSLALRPSNLHERLSRPRFGSHLLRSRGASPSPDEPSLNRETSSAGAVREVPFGLTS
jgi:hypothetical protein